MNNDSAGVRGVRETGSVSPIHELPTHLQALVGFEQRNLWRVEKYRANLAVSDFDEMYLPERRGVFFLPCSSVRREDLYVYGDGEGLRYGIRELVHDVRDNTFILPVHPAEFARQTELLPTQHAESAARDSIRLLATPMSSTRTLLAWPEGHPESAFFTKLSLMSRLFGDRRLDRRKVAASVWRSQLVGKLMRQLPPEMGYFAEPWGIVRRNQPERGLLFRAIPEELRGGKELLAPLFALMGGGRESPPLALQLIVRYGNDGFAALKDILLCKFAKLWVDLVFDFGILLEAHGQDLLLTWSPAATPQGRFYYRDFEGMAVDWALCRARGLPEPGGLHAWEWFSTYETCGYRLYQLVSVKMISSLFDYLHLVLGELESAVLEWQASGAIARGTVREGELTFVFSRCLRYAIQEKFGMSEGENYDIRHRLARFVKFLMQVRRDVMNGSRELASI